MSGDKNLWADKTFLGTKPIGGQTYLGTKPIGGQNLWADKTYRGTTPIGRQNLSSDKTFRRTKPIGRKNLSAGKCPGRYVQGGADSIRDRLGRARSMYAGGEGGRCYSARSHPFPRKLLDRYL
jgi:hypothetical protein